MLYVLRTIAVFDVNCPGFMLGDVVVHVFRPMFFIPVHILCRESCGLALFPYILAVSLDCVSALFNIAEAQ